MSLESSSSAETVETHTDYLSGIFRRCVAVIAGTYALDDDTYVQREAFEYIVMLAEIRMQELFSSLLKFTNIQRRSQPSLEDIAALLSLHDINVCDLEDERRRLSSDSSNAVLAQHLNELEFTGDLEAIPKSEQAFYEAPRSILPSRKRAPPYAPAWVPALPPDHTYMKTPKFTNHVHNLQTLRERVFEEGQLAEQALQRVLGSSGSSSVVALIEPDSGTEPNRPNTLTGDLDLYTGSSNKEISPLTKVDYSERQDTDVSRAQSPGQTITRESATPSITSEARLDLASEAPEDESTRDGGQTIKREPSPVHEKEQGGSILKLPKLKLKALSPVKSEKTATPKLRLSLGGGSAAPSASLKRATNDNKIAKKHDFYGKRPRVDILKLSHASETESSPQTRRENEQEKDVTTVSIDELFTGALMSIP